MLNQVDIIHENCYSELVFLKIKNRKTTKDRVDLLLQMNFGGPQEKRFKIGSVLYELKRGSLRMKLINATVPYELRYLNGRIEAYYVSKREVEELCNKEHVNENSRSGGLSFGSSLKGPKASASIKDMSKRSNSYGEREKIKETFDHIEWMVTSKGSEEEPVWDFWPEKGKRNLKYNIQDKLCTINVLKRPCCLDATFEVSHRDILLRKVEGIWPGSLIQNKRKIIKIFLLRSIAKDLSPYISRHKVKYE